MRLQDIAPGYVDLQVNGFCGIDFSAPGLTVAQVHAVAVELGRRGTAAFCPTVITSPMEVYEANLPVIAAAMDDPGEGAKMVGFHIEGPFISPLDGARGAHTRAYVQPPNLEVFDRIWALTGGRISLLTLAPEIPGALELIREATARGIKVSLGHHLADEEQLGRACEAGATLVTHFGNGLPNLLPRHHNPLWLQLAEPRLQLMIIGDGHHLPAPLIRTVFACRGSAEVIVVSDAAPVGGLPPGDYHTLGQAVRLEPNGKLWNPVANHLVGSSYSMRECMEYIRTLGVADDRGLEHCSRDNALKVLEIQ